MGCLFNPGPSASVEFSAIQGCLLALARITLIAKTSAILPLAASSVSRLWRPQLGHSPKRRHKLHVELDHTITLTTFAAATADVKGKAIALVTTKI